MAAQRRVLVDLPDGVHARPVAQLAKLAQQHHASVTLTTADGTTVDLASVLALMDLALSAGDIVTLHAEGPGADTLLRSLASILAPLR